MTHTYTAYTRAPMVPFGHTFGVKKNCNKHTKRKIKLQNVR